MLPSWPSAFSGSGNAAGLRTSRTALRGHLLSEPEVHLAGGGGVCFHPGRHEGRSSGSRRRRCHEERPQLHETRWIPFQSARTPSRSPRAPWFEDLGSTITTTQLNRRRFKDPTRVLRGADADVSVAERRNDRTRWLIAAFRFEGYGLLGASRPWACGQRNLPKGAPRAMPKRCVARRSAGSARAGAPPPTVWPEMPPRGGREECMKGPRPARMPVYGAGSKYLGGTQKETGWLRFHAPQAPGNSHCAPTPPGITGRRRSSGRKSASGSRDCCDTPCTAR